MSDSYQIPFAAPEASEMARKRCFWRWNIVVSAAIMVGMPVVSFVRAIVGMRHSFAGLGESGADVNELGAHIGELMVATVIASVAGLVALVWLVISALRYRSIPKPGRDNLGP